MLHGCKLYGRAPRVYAPLWPKWHFIFSDRLEAVLRFCYFQSMTSSAYGLLLILLAMMGNAGVALQGPELPCEKSLEKL